MLKFQLDKCLDQISAANRRVNALQMKRYPISGMSPAVAQKSRLDIF